ncbi:MAG: TIGR04076 family protein [Desulfobacterales bacterium]|nr:TIGR04076 family protein [Desulfobacterales bacterium]
MNMHENAWRQIQQHLGYTDAELRLFRENPKNEEILARIPELMSKTIIGEVVESHGCNSLHKVGDKFYFDGAGNLLTRKCPKRVCVYALKAFATLIYGANELVYAGLDPNDLRFKRVSCHDVGVERGGWGRIVIEIKVEERE